MRALEADDLQNILVGCAFLGTGGGGSLKEGLAIVRANRKAGRAFRLASLGELPGDTWVATPYYCGSLVPSGESAFAAHQARYKGRECALAFRLLEKHLGRSIGATVATELGGGNTAAAFCVAAELGLPILDADGAGRSVPDLQHSTYHVAGVPIAPMGIVNKFGDAVVIPSVADDFHAEVLVRAIAVASGGTVGVADHPGEIQEVRKGLVADSITFAEKVGRAIQDRTKDLLSALLKATGGLLLFRGIAASDCKYEDRDGFTFGEIALRGEEGFRGSRYRIWFKNENIIAWRDGRVDVTAPDLICLVDEDRGEPILNPWARRGQRVAVLGLPAHPIWRTPKGIETFGPRYFGFRVRFIPVEKRRRRKVP